MVRHTSLKKRRRFGVQLPRPVDVALRSIPHLRILESCYQTSPSRRLSPSLLRGPPPFFADSIGVQLPRPVDVALRSIPHLRILESCYQTSPSRRLSPSLLRGPPPFFADSIGVQLPRPVDVALRSIPHLRILESCYQTSPSIRLSPSLLRGPPPFFADSIGVQLPRPVDVALRSIPHLRILESCYQTSPSRRLSPSLLRGPPPFFADSIGVQLPIPSRSVPVCQEIVCTGPGVPSSLGPDTSSVPNYQFRPCLLCPFSHIDLTSTGVQLPVQSSKIGDTFDQLLTFFSPLKRDIKNRYNSPVPTGRRPPTSPRGTLRRSVQHIPDENVEVTRYADGSPPTVTTTPFERGLREPAVEHLTNVEPLRDTGMSRISPNTPTKYQRQ